MADMDRSLSMRIEWITEDLIRPRLARLSDFWQNLIVRWLARRHFKNHRAHGVYSKELWKREKSEHFIRDRWTVPFAHRHSFKEVINWFLERRSEYRLVDPKRYYDHFKDPLIGIGLRGAPLAMLPQDAGAVRCRSDRAVV
jgi:hypothetical protein